MSHASVSARPTIRITGGQAFGAACSLGTIIVHNYVRYRGAERVAAMVIVCASILASLLLGRRWARRACLTVEGDTLRYSGVLGMQTVPAGTATRVVVVTVEGPATGRRDRLWLLLDGHDQAKLALYTPPWADHDLHCVAEVLGLSPEIDAKPRSPRELRRLYPRSVPWPYAHVYWFTLLLIGVGTVLLLVGQALTGVHVS